MARLAGSVLVSLALTLAATMDAAAGGPTFLQDDEAAAPPSIFGFVTDKNGDAVADAKITVSVASLNSSMIVRADDQGHYTVSGFDKSINPKTIDVTCSKEGYLLYSKTERPPDSPQEPLEVDCVLVKQ